MNALRPPWAPLRQVLCGTATPLKRDTTSSCVSIVPTVRGTAHQTLRGPRRYLSESANSSVTRDKPQPRRRGTAPLLLVSSVSFLLGTVVAYKNRDQILLLLSMGPTPSDDDTLSMYKAPDRYSRSIDEHIRTCVVAQKARARSDFGESRPHLKVPEAMRPHNLTVTTLAGPGMLVVPPYVWTQKEGKEMVSIFYVGENVSGHAGMVHGGFLATMLDEGLARCCFPALPNQLGVTANLQINYLKPTSVDQYLVLKATTTKVDGRKAWVTGWIETMPEDGGEPVKLVEASALYVEPKNAATLKKLYRIT